MCIELLSTMCDVTDCALFALLSAAFCAAATKMPPTQPAHFTVLLRLRSHKIHLRSYFLTSNIANIIQIHLSKRCENLKSVLRQTAGKILGKVRSTYDIRPLISVVRL